MYERILLHQVVTVFENLHRGRILCSAVGGENMLLTGGDSTVCSTYHYIILTLHFILHVPECSVNHVNNTLHVQMTKAVSPLDCVCLGDEECRVEGPLSCAAPIEAHPPWSH